MTHDHPICRSRKALQKEAGPDGRHSIHGVLGLGLGLTRRGRVSSSWARWKAPNSMPTLAMTVPHDVMFTLTVTLRTRKVPNLNPNPMPNPNPKFLLRISGCQSNFILFLAHLSRFASVGVKIDGIGQVHCLNVFKMRVQQSLDLASSSMSIKLQMACVRQYTECTQSWLSSVVCMCAAT